MEAFYEGKIILVTGGAGAIGVNLCKKLVIFGAAKVIILDNLSSSYIWNIPDSPNILFIKGDIRNKNDLLRVFKMRPQIVFHLAAFFANQNSVDYPILSEEVNVSGLLNVLELSVISGCVERFVYSNSEGGAYGSDSMIPYKEENISINLSTPYYISKLTGEAYCRFYHQHYNLAVSIVRLFNSYGPGEVPGVYRNVIPNFIFWAMKKQPLPLTGDPGMTRDFVFVNDTVEGLLRSGYIQSAIGDAFNVCSAREVFIYEIAEKINLLTNNPSGTIIATARKWDTRKSIVGNPEKCNRVLLFQPCTQFEDGLIATIEWFRNRWSLIEKTVEFPPGYNPATSTKCFNNAE